MLCLTCSQGGDVRELYIERGREVIGGIAGGWVGANGGAAIGTMIRPGISTVMVGIADGLAGYCGGSWIGSG